MVKTDHDAPRPATQAGYWDRLADDFDAEPDHGLADAATRARWRDVLAAALGPNPLTVLDIGCGTGTLSLLMDEMGHTVHGIDFSKRMVAAARRKAAGRSGPTFSQGDAQQPDPSLGPVDALVCRHVLWALPDPEAALAKWRALLHPGGRLVAIEGSWHTGAGLSMTACVKLVSARFGQVETRDLVPQSGLWGGPVSDERYLVSARAGGRR